VRDILCLNRNFYAIHIIDWTRAMTLLYTNRVSVVDSDFRKYDFNDWVELSKIIGDNPNGYIRTTNFKIAVPEIVALNFYDELPETEVKFTRKNLYHHYSNRCCYCDKRFKTSELNLDHVLPKSKGGKSSWENIVLSCIPCNSLKDNRSPHDAGLKMNYQPNKPAWRPSYAVSIRGGLKIQQSWKKFIDEAYWNMELENENQNDKLVH